MALLRRLAEALWDDASFALARGRHEHPGVARAAGFAAEVVQRPLRPVRSAEGPVRLLFAGSDRQLFATLARTFGATRTRVDGWLPWGAPLPSRDVDVEATEIPWWRVPAARNAGALVLPRWVGLGVDLDDERLDARRRELMGRAQSWGAAAEVIPAGPGLNAFFERYYLPTARARHGSEAHLLRLRYLRHAARDAELLYVRRGARRLAGALLVWRNAQVVDAWVTGVLDGDYGLGDSAARVALYVLAMRHARASGAHHLGLTSAAPFLGDGLLRYKRAFGARATALPWYPVALRLDVRRGGQAVADAFARSPPVHQGAGGLAAVSLAIGAPSTGRTARFALPGIDGPYVLRDDSEALVRRLAAWASSPRPDPG